MTRWWLIGAAVFLAVLLIASIVLALTSKEAEFAPGTPENAVQTLLRTCRRRRYRDGVFHAFAGTSAEMRA